MATTLGTIAVRLTTETQQFMRGLGRANKSLQKFSADMRATGMAMGAVGVGFGLLGAKMVKTAADFEEAMVTVGAVSRTLGTKTFGELEAKAKQMGATTRFTATQSANAMKNMAMAGLEAKDIISGIPHVLNLASAGSLDLASSADIVTNIMSGFGKQSSDLGDVNDMLVNTFTRANVNLMQMGESFKMVGPIAKAAGVSINETSAAIGMLGNVGIRGTMAGVALKQGIASLIAPTSKQAGIMDALGISVQKNADGTVNLAGTLEQVSPIAHEAGLMLELFGDRAGPAMAGLIGQGSDKLRELTTATHESGTASRIAAAKNNTFNGQMDLMKSSVDAAMQSIGQALIPTLRDLNSSIKSVFDWFNRLTKEQKESTAKTFAMTGAFLGFGGAAMLVVGSLVKVGGAMMTIGRMLKTVLSPLKLIRFAFSKMGFIIIGIIALGASLYELYKFYAVEIGNIFTNLGKWIGGVFSDIGMIVSAVGGYIGDTFSRLSDYIYKVFVSGILDMLGVSRGEFESFGQGIFKFFTDLANNLIIPFRWLGDKIGEILSTAFDFWKDNLPGWLQTALDFWAKKINSVKADLGEKTGVTKIAETFSGIFEGNAGNGGSLGKRGGNKKFESATKDFDKGVGIFGLTASKDMKSKESFATAVREFEKLTGRGFGKKEPKGLAVGDAQVKSDYYASLGTGVLQAGGKAGSLASDTMQGAAAAGPWGAVAGAAMNLLKQTDGFSDIVGFLSGVIEKLVPVLEPLVEAIKPIAAIIGELVPMLTTMLKPVIKILADTIEGPVFEVLRGVAFALGWVFKGVARVWNTILSILAKVIGWIPRKGKEWAKKIEKYKMDVGSIAESMNNFKEMTQSSAKAQVKAANDITESSKSMNQQLTNLPQGFKIALRRFEATTPGLATNTPGIGTINVNAANPAEFWDKTKTVMANDNFANTGSTQYTSGPYSVVGSGSTHVK